MKKSTLVQVTRTLGATCMEDLTSLYISDERTTTWVDYTNCEDAIERDAFLEIGKRVLAQDASYGVLVHESDLSGKIRDFDTIRVVILLSIARRYRHYTYDVDFDRGLALSGRPKATSVRNLMLLKYQEPEIAGAPLYGVHS